MYITSWDTEIVIHFPLLFGCPVMALPCDMSPFCFRECSGDWAPRAAVVTQGVPRSMGQHLPRRRLWAGGQQEEVLLLHLRYSPDFAVTARRWHHRLCPHRQPRTEAMLLQQAPAPTYLCPWPQLPFGEGSRGLPGPAGTLLLPLTAPSCSHLPEADARGGGAGGGGGRGQLLGHAVHRGAGVSHAPGTLSLLRGPNREPPGHARGEDHQPPSHQEQICLQEVLWEERVSPRQREKMPLTCFLSSSWAILAWSLLPAPVHGSLPPQGQEAVPSGSAPASPGAALCPSHCSPQPQPGAEHPSCPVLSLGAAGSPGILMTHSTSTGGWMMVFIKR